MLNRQLLRRHAWSGLLCSYAINCTKAEAMWVQDDESWHTVFDVGQALASSAPEVSHPLRSIHRKVSPVLYDPFLLRLIEYLDQYRALSFGRYLRRHLRCDLEDAYLLRGEQPAA